MLVTAHPDDECMFFGPTICNLSQDLQTKIYLLCLSSGNFYGEGEKRRQELHDSCEILSIPRANVIILNDENLQDGMDNYWDPDVISNIVVKYSMTWKINWIVTFDNHGISGHPNHKAIFCGIQKLVKSDLLPVGIEIYILKTIGLMRKYTSFLDIFYSAAVACTSSDTVFFSSIRNVLKTQKAMISHRSQMQWFRWLYIIFSRYMIVNTLSPLLPIHEHND